jgi:hypothetical protein
VADVIKVLGQSAPAATTTTTLYTVPNLNQTTVSSLVICNRTGGALTYRVSVQVADAAADDKQYLYYDKTLAANETFSAVLGLTLNQSDVVKVYASNTGLSFNMFGVETS